LKKYQSLLFDADDTLLDFRKAEHEALQSSVGLKNAEIK
jgi:FMN phosphatase YigB (HAD superfamily)